MTFRVNCILLVLLWVWSFYFCNLLYLQECFERHCWFSFLPNVCHIDSSFSTLNSLGRCQIWTGNVFSTVTNPFPCFLVCNKRAVSFFLQRIKCVPSSESTVSLSGSQCCWPIRWGTHDPKVGYPLCYGLQLKNPVTSAIWQPPKSLTQIFPSVELLPWGRLCLWLKESIIFIWMYFWQRLISPEVG